LREVGKRKRRRPIRTWKKQVEEDIKRINLARGCLRSDVERVFKYLDNGLLWKWVNSATVVLMTENKLDSF